jgi:hypothetical protein
LDEDPNDPNSKYTHMIGIPWNTLEYLGIPLDTNYDLLLELESIQRGILYHSCPLLINAVIAHVLTRMPLLFIDTTPSSSSPPATVTNDDENDFSQVNEIFQRNKQENESTSSSFFSNLNQKKNDILASRDPITQELHTIVEEDVVKEMVLIPLNMDRCR